jgi:Bacterial TniB protein
VIDSPAHVTEEAAALLHASGEARIRYILSKPWVHYPKAKRIVELVHGLLRHPRTTRMPSIAVYGDSGMGKSMIVGRFKHDAAFFADADFGKAQRRFLVVELSGGPGERRLYAQILTALGAPHNPRATIVGLGACPSNRFLEGSILYTVDVIAS